MTIKTFIKKATFRILWEIIVTGREKLNPLLGKYRKKNLLGTNFTILSNNCWGGACISQIFNRLQYTNSRPVYLAGELY